MGPQELSRIGHYFINEVVRLMLSKNANKKYALNKYISMKKIEIDSNDF